MCGSLSIGLLSSWFWFVSCPTSSLVWCCLRLQSRWWSFAELHVAFLGQLSLQREDYEQRARQGRPALATLSQGSLIDYYTSGTVLRLSCMMQWTGFSLKGCIPIAIRARFNYEGVRDAYDSSTIQHPTRSLRGVMWIRAIMNMSILLRCCTVL